jgi:hypothetical protein
MITSEEVRNTLIKYYAKKEIKYFTPNNRKGETQYHDWWVINYIDLHLIKNYITQQEKQEELLELKTKLLSEYDNIFNNILADIEYIDSKLYIQQCETTHNIHQQIKALESELK